MGNKEWTEMSLGEFVRLQRGHDLTDRERRPGTVPVMGSAGQNGFHDTAKAKGPGVVIGRSGVGSMGVVTYCATDYWPHNTVLYVTDFLGNDERFVYYFLQHLNLRRFNSGSAQASLNRNYVYPIRICVPGAKEQRAIAQTLGALDDRIDLSMRMNVTMEAVLRGLFKSWFIDFAPVRARTQGLEPNGMDDKIASLFPSGFEKSELGPIPKGWRVVPFADTVHIHGGGTPKTSVPEYWDGDIPWFSAGDAPTGGQVFVINTEKRITRLGLENSSARLLPPWTTIISARGTVGKLAITGRHMAMNQSCYGLQSKASGVTFTYLAAQQLVVTLKRLAHGAVFDTITRDTLKSVKVVLPDEPTLKAFDALTLPLFDRVLANCNLQATLTDLRDTLLPRLISGQIPVPEAQEAIQEVLS